MDECEEVYAGHTTHRGRAAVAYARVWPQGWREWVLVWCEPATDYGWPLETKQAIVYEAPRVEL